mmetsp:Transcript_10232/g.8788  ORF Transcript_10232/g.8788 Transcript_10232/m.8788 type:complete len:112 (+) Transcript_10232:32-367(+)|eukprot:CAMPEP_0114582136 /NCGR_PEP_ID=MMETSP0125-20121206/6165_1 /TAXON_ID=485358 ORGANISM="Aristerostoma sp., Strain ATCC 50986" /NCGR_SAMPLE_ID=MMETSP0125 /ASSEMBLY_ACC=CAM_ASM_000245 /LENGTH=111 /DNA_ID=CAMNT_0001774883 /DNA_START=319 /DNA_END=654 /DNA_ORIENTATION=-
MGKEWHQDGDLYLPPLHYQFTFLLSKIVPPVGGKTGFKDLRALYESVDQSVKDHYDGSKYLLIPESNPDFEKDKLDLFPKIEHDFVHEGFLNGTKSFYPCSIHGTIRLKNG